MTKKIIQTTIITLIAIICVIAFTWGAVTIISPYTMGKFSQKLGADKSASAYFEIDYKRNKSDDRLYNLVSSTFYANKYGKTIKYGNELLKRESFVNSYTNKNYIDIVIYVAKSKYSCFLVMLYKRIIGSKIDEEFNPRQCLVALLISFLPSCTFPIFEIM